MRALRGLGIGMLVLLIPVLLLIGGANDYVRDWSDAKAAVDGRWKGWSGGAFPSRTQTGWAAVNASRGEISIGPIFPSREAAVLWNNRNHHSGTEVLKVSITREEG